MKSKNKPPTQPYREFFEDTCSRYQDHEFWEYHSHESEEQHLRQQVEELDEKLWREYQEVSSGKSKKRRRR